MPDPPAPGPTAPDPDRTFPDATPGALDAGLAAAFGPPSGQASAHDGSFVLSMGETRVQLREATGEPGAGAEPSGRLQLHGEIARGGMGAILLGRDPNGGREVTVKVLLEVHAGRTEFVRRFLEEAQIAGQLQHPGVVPVYELSQFPDRRPYFTMKLVQGQTLATQLGERN